MSTPAASAREHSPCMGVRLCRACAAAYLGVSLDSFDDHARVALPAVRIGAKVGFLRPDLDTFAQSRREAPSAVRQSPRSGSAAASGTSVSPSQAGASLARRASEIADGLKPRSPRGGSRRTEPRAKSLRLV